MKLFKYFFKIGLISLCVVVLSACAKQGQGAVKSVEPNDSMSVSSTDSSTDNSNSNSNSTANESNREIKLDKNQYMDYSGKTDQGAPVQLTLFATNDSIEGALQFNKNGEPYYQVLSGKLDKGQLIMYLEGQASGNGIVIKSTGEDELTAVSGLDAVIGGRGSVVMKLSDIVYGEFGNRYGVSGFNEDRVVDEWVKTLKEKLAQKDQAWIADQMAFPIQTQLDGKQVSMDKAVFEKSFDKVMTPELTEAITNHFDKMLFANANGVMVGGGEYNLWVGAVEKDGRVVPQILSINH